MDDEQIKEKFERMMENQKRAIKKYYLKNKKQICDYGKTYYETHKEEILIKKRQQYHMKKNQEQ